MATAYSDRKMLPAYKVDGELVCVQRSGVQEAVQHDGYLGVIPLTGRDHIRKAAESRQERYSSYASRVLRYLFFQARIHLAPCVQDRNEALSRTND